MMTEVTGGIGGRRWVQPERAATARGSADGRSERKLALLPHSSAPQRARDFVAETLSQWGLDDCVEPAVLITSELVTNAVQHAGTDITVSILRSSTEVRIEVADQAADLGVSAGAARARQAGGVGLVIVGRLAEQWGVDRRGDGKCVWATLVTDPGGQPAPAADR